MLRFTVAVAAGGVVGLLAGLAMAALGARTVGYVAAITLAGWSAAVAVTWRSAPHAGWSIAAVVAPLGATLIVAAPRPYAAGPDRLSAPSSFRTDDGQVIAYQEFHPPSADGAVPMVFLNGGPGVSTRSQDTSWLTGISRTRSVVVYDQVGAGDSSRLHDPTGYTLKRARQDLEQVRRHLDLDRMILVGHSWGAVVAAEYVAHHPHHVEAFIALAPGALTPGVDVADDPSVRLRGADRARLLGRLLRPRELYAYGLATIDVHVAHRVAGDDEMDRRYDAILRAVWPAMFCDASLAKDLPAPRGGFYANHVGQQAARDVVDVPVADPPATLVVKPQCDYLSWSVVDGYVDDLAAQVAYVPGAGHAVHLEQPGDVAEVLEDFVAGRTPGGLLEAPKTVPATFRGPP